jgi:hypothetical protein
MSINFKATVLVLGAVCLFSAGQANAADCNRSEQVAGWRMGRTVQCYYLPTVSNGRVTGLQREVSYGAHDRPYGGSGYGAGAGATIGSGDRPGHH